MGTYDVEAAKIKRQRMIADALRASGNESLPAFIQTGGRMNAPVSKWEYANKALQTVLGALQAREADKSETKLNEQDKAQLAELMQAKTEADQPDAPMGDTDPVPVLPEYNKQQRQQKLQAAVLRGQQFGGASEPFANEITKQKMFPAEYTLGADDTRMRGDQPMAYGLPRTVRESPDDRALINISDPKNPKGYRTIKRADFKDGDQLWEKPAAASGGGAGGAASENMSDEAVDNAALDVIRAPESMRQYAVGNGNAARQDRVRINNAVVKKMKDAGLSNNQVAQFRGRVQGELKSQKDLVGMSNAVQSYEKLAKANGQRLLELVKDVNTTNVPAINGLLQYAKNKGAGDVDTAEFQSVLKTYQTEVARIIAQPRLVGQLTDTQIEEMKKVVDGTASAPQLRRVVSRLDIEMGIRAKSVEDQIAMSGGNLNIPGTEPTTPPVTTPGDHSSLWN